MSEGVNAIPLAVYDLDGDGAPEVIYSNWTHLLVLDGRDGSLKFEFHPQAPNWTDTMNVEDAAVVDLKEGGKEIFVTVGYCGMVYALSAGGEVLWGISLMNESEFTAEGCGWWALALSGISDIDMDGELELLINDVTEDTGTLYCIDTRGHLEWVFPMDGGFIVRNPVIADLNGDGRPEIAVMASRLFHWENRYIYLLDGSGKLKWSIRVSATGGGLSAYDLNGNGIPEIIFGCGEALCAVEYGKGVVWSVGVTGNVTGSPAIADLDGDDRPEIILITREGYLNIVHPPTGKAHVKLPTEQVTQPPVVADIDGDGEPEILCILPVWDRARGHYVDAMLYVLNSGGSVEWSLDLHNVAGGLEAPVVADIDGDGELEILVRRYNRLVALDSADAYLDVTPSGPYLNVTWGFRIEPLNRPEVAVQVSEDGKTLAVFKAREISIKVGPGSYRITLLMNGRPFKAVEAEISQESVSKTSQLTGRLACTLAAMIILLLVITSVVWRVRRKRSSRLGTS